MYKRRIILIICLLLFSQLAAACTLGGGAVEPENIQLVIWKPFESQENLYPIIQAYQLQHHNVTIIYHQKDIATYESDLLNALAAGAGPDIFSIHNDWLASYQNKLSPAPKDVYSLREFEETFVDAARQDLYDLEDNLYAVPLSMDVLALYYNRDLLGSAGISVPPRTWEEVIAAVKKMTRQDKFGNFIVNGIAMGTASNINRSADILALLMLQNGTQVYNSSRSIANISRDVAAPDGTRYNPGSQALEFYTQFANPAKQTYTWNNRNNYSIDAFAAGQVGMMLGYSYLVADLDAKAPLLNYGVAPVPQIDLTKPKVNYPNYFAEAVSKASPNTKAAWDFLKFATSAESLKSYYAVHKLPSSRKDIIAEQISDGDIGVFAEGALTAKTFYKPDAGKIDAAFNTMIDDVILRGRSAIQAVSNASQVLSDLLR